MVLLGGLQAISGPWLGGALFTWLQDTVARQTDYWRALLGFIMLAIVLLFPLGVAGSLKRRLLREPA
jgi:branched-chain amino acid transport system permease protein